MGYLDDVTRRRIAAVLMLAVIAVGALALTDVGPFSDPPTQEERAQATVEDFFAAARERDFRTMCGLLSPATRVRILQRTATLLGVQSGLERCPDALEAQHKALAAQDATTLSDTRVVSVADSRVSGNRAAVDIELRFPGAKRPEPRTFQLELVGESWKISGSVL